MRFLLASVALILAVVFFREIFDAVKRYKATRWKSTLGKLADWHIVTEADSEHTKVVVRNTRYVYRVSGKDYESSNMGFGFPSVMSALYVERTLEKLLSRAPEIDVHYDPTNPQRRVLSVGVQLHHVVKILVFGFLAVVVMLIFHAEP